MAVTCRKAQAATAGYMADYRPCAVPSVMTGRCSVPLERGERVLARQRRPPDRMVGCCRDATVFFLALARHRVTSA